VTVIVKHCGVEDNFVDIPGQGISAVLSSRDLTGLLRGRRGGAARCGRTPRRGQRNGIAIDIERWLLFRRDGRRRALLRQHRGAESQKKKE
jgi:hypothetical protein